MSAKRRSEGSIHEYNETKVTDFEEQEAPHAAFTTLIYKKQKPNPATIMFAQREEAHRQPQQEATPPQESPVKHDKDAAIRILTQSGKPLPLNLDTLTSEKAKSTNTEKYNIPDLATTLVYMARGQEGVTKLQDKDLTVFRCPVSGPVGGSGSTRNSKFVEIQRNENVVWVNVDFNHDGLSPTPAKLHLYVAFTVSRNGAWTAYKCGKGWLVEESKDPKDIGEVTQELVRALLIKIAAHRNVLRVGAV